MIVTEKEAATKVCFITMGQEIVRNCIGSRCMRWAWHDKVTKDGVVITLRDDGFKFEDKGRPLSSRRGLCGMQPRF